MTRSVESAPAADAGRTPRRRAGSGRGWPPAGLRLHGPHPPHDPLDAVVVHGGVARTSGQLPRIDGELTCIGTLGDSVDVEEGARAAAVCALNALSVLEVALGSLDRVERVLTVTGFVASTPTSTRQPAVVDGASAGARPGLRRGGAPHPVGHRGGRRSRGAGPSRSR